MLLIYNVMDPIIKVNGKMEKNMEKEYRIGLKEIFIKVNGKMEKGQVGEFIFGLMAITMRVNMLMISEMVLVYSDGQMVENIEDIT